MQICIFLNEKCYVNVEKWVFIIIIFINPPDLQEITGRSTKANRQAIAPTAIFNFVPKESCSTYFQRIKNLKFFSLLIKILSLRSWSDEGALHVSCHGKAFFSDFLR